MKVSKYILIFVFVASQFILTAQEEIRFMDGSLAAIMSIAKQRNKNVFIDTYADWCVPCKRMEKKFKDRDVAAFFNEHFINYRVNMQNPTRANELRRKYDVVFLPTMYILDPEGKVKYHVDKELTTSELLNAGQRSLDPGSFVSDATTVRRKDGTVTGNTVNPSTKVSPPKDNHTPKTVEPEPIVVEANKPKTKSEPIHTSTGGISLSEATRRSKILDSYETVEGSSEKVLAVLGAGEMPPEVLKQEAYLRLEFMDGSHRAVASNYLTSQSDWSTKENRKFILDFINSTSSKEYDYIVSNKSSFIEQFGIKKINRTLEVLVYKTLHNAVPRPTLEESVELYSNIDSETAVKKGNHYFVNRLIADKDEDRLKSVGQAYLNGASSDHEMMYTLGRYFTNKIDGSDEDLSFASDMMEDALALTPNTIIYLDLLGTVYSEQGKTKKAKKIYRRAIEAAKDQGKEYKQYEAKSQAAN